MKEYSRENAIRLAEVADELYDSGVLDKKVWSKICSCMDWLSVASNTLELPKLSKGGNYLDKDSIEVLKFILQVDILIESIEGLWLAYEEGVNIEMKELGSRHIFSGNEMGRELTDKEYFKLIRAWLGVHSVNGNKTRLPNYKEEVRFFTSWSHCESVERCQINVYSNNNQAEEEFGGIKVIDLNKVLELAMYYYKSLEELLQKLNTKTPLKPQ